MTWPTRGSRPDDDALVVAYAERLCELAATIEPSDDFRSGLRATLMAAAPPVLVKPVRTTPAAKARSPRTRRRMAIVTGLVASSLGMGGLASASTSAVPGDLLYPVKRAVEAVQLAIRSDEKTEGLFRLEFAKERLAEATELSRESGPAAAEAREKSLQEFQTQAALGSSDLLDAYRVDSDPADIAALNRFSESSLRDLRTLQSSLSGADLGAVLAARQQVVAIVDSSIRLCADCAKIAAAVTESLAKTVQPTVAARPSEAANRATDGGSVGSSTPTANRSTNAPAVVATQPERPAAETSGSTTSNPATATTGSGIVPASVPTPTHAPDLPGTQIDNKVRDGVRDTVSGLLR